MDTFLQAINTIGVVIGGLVVIATTIAVIWYLARGRVRKEIHETESERLRPWREAAEGYELQVSQLKGDVNRLERELTASNDERKALRARVKELESDYLSLAQTNQRQQGEIDRLKRQVADMADMRTQLLEALAKLKQ